MWRKIVFIVIGLIIGALLGAVIGLYLGAIIGGNFMTSFRFNGVQGYEATGQIGAGLGIILGAVLGITTALKLTNRRKKKLS